VDYIADHDDFPKNQRFDNGHPVIRVSDIMGSQKESSILRESSEHEGEVTNNYQVLVHFANYFFLQIAFFLVSVIHGLWRFQFH
jgi:hypothetical protein